MTPNDFPHNFPPCTLNLSLPSAFFFLEQGLCTIFPYLTNYNLNLFLTTHHQTNPDFFRHHLVLCVRRSVSTSVHPSVSLCVLLKCLSLYLKFTSLQQDGWKMIKPSSPAAGLQNWPSPASHLVSLVEQFQT